MKGLAVRILSAFLNLWYALCRIPGRKREVLFLSRQSNKMSTDFKLLSHEVEKHGGYFITARTKMVDDGSVGALMLVGRMFGDVKALARCSICFVEGYNPAVSLLNMKCDPYDSQPGIVNDRFPTEPVVMQVWHAAGHFKKFGYEALDTPEGRSSADAEIFHMHRNYSWVACSGEGARQGFADAFCCPVERVVALGHPSFDELYEDPEPSIARVRKLYPEYGVDGKPVVVFAPTLHCIRGNQMFEDLKKRMESDPRSSKYHFAWSFHPVSKQGTEIRVSTRDLLRCASLVITDYSSVVYDAAILDVPFAFYVPDIEEYRESPGLATDPGLLSPGLCLASPDELLEFLDQVFTQDPEASAYPITERDAFIGSTLSACSPGSAARIVEFTLDHV